jgi:ribosomal protein S18 acetylase RimI-like enzyme
VSALTLRSATVGEAGALAALHTQRISEGFLPTLGPAFLARLYRRLLRSPLGAVIVAAGEPGTIAGLAAGTTDVAAFYRSFLVRDGLPAAIRAAPQVARALPRVRETLRYPSTTGTLPRAEVLAVAVTAGAAGQGLGAGLVTALCGELERRGARAVKVVAATDNTAARRCYLAAQFAEHSLLVVHGTRASTVYVRTVDGTGS